MGKHTSSSAQNNPAEWTGWVTCELSFAAIKKKAVSVTFVFEETD